MEQSERKHPLQIHAKSGVGSPTVAAVEITDTEHCSVCNMRLQPILVSGIPSGVCWDHRVVLPQKNALNFGTPNV